MNVGDVITIGQDALWTAVLIASPLLGTALLLGVVIGVLQAATSIQEMTLSFIPKLVVSNFFDPPNSKDAVFPIP